MLTIENLKKFGADTDMGIKRCANNEALYLRLVTTVPSNQGFNSLYESIKNNNLDDAFTYAHGLKGILANLSLDPLANVVVEITEHLRKKEQMDYSSYISIIENKRKELEDIIK